MSVRVPWVSVLVLAFLVGCGGDDDPDTGRSDCEQGCFEVELRPCRDNCQTECAEQTDDERDRCIDACEGDCIGEYDACVAQTCDAQ